MATTIHVAQSGVELPRLRTIGLADLGTALREGLADFARVPSHAVFLCLLYPLVGLLVGGFLFGYDMVPLLYPLAAGFALVGPFAAVGLYELSRRLELGLDSSWEHAFDVFRSPAGWSVLALGLLLTAIFVGWLTSAQWLYGQTVGTLAPASVGDFVGALFTTSAGWSLIVWGNLLGLVFAVVALSVSVVSFPLLIDRHVSAPVAMLTSMRAVIANPVPMAAWGVIVAAALVLGSIPFLAGLAFVMPVLGHATWHLYRRTVLPA
ncbi:MAG TPA: DUF2189 domain-containing protein [Rhizomicrobium sp.]|jgi:uncharacterized membrane protein